MGRGRAKAKQTKVARELKYSTPNTDLTALQRELAAGGDHPATLPPPPAPADEVDSDEEYEELAGKYDADEDDDWVASR